MVQRKLEGFSYLFQFYFREKQEDTKSGEASFQFTNFNQFQILYKELRIQITNSLMNCGDIEPFLPLLGKYKQIQEDKESCNTSMK